MYKCSICKKISQQKETQFNIYSYKKNIVGYDIISQKRVCKSCYDDPKKNKESKF
jgi:hypothetical protein